MLVTKPINAAVVIAGVWEVGISTVARTAHRITSVTKGIPARRSTTRFPSSVGRTTAIATSTEATSPWESFAMGMKSAVRGSAWLPARARSALSSAMVHVLKVTLVQVVSVCRRVPNPTALNVMLMRSVNQHYVWR